MISRICPFCINSAKKTADKKQWRIHFAGHREGIIKNLTNSRNYCMICSHSNLFNNKNEISDHYRWSHKRGEIVNIAMQYLQN